MTSFGQKTTPDVKKPEDDAASEILSSDQFSSQQLEGLTDTDQLDQQFNEENNMQSTQSNLDKKESTDDSKGNQAIKEVAESIDKKELEDNLKGKKPDQPTENPAPFISQDDA